MARNAMLNGVEFKFDTEVTDLKPIDEGWEIHTNNGVFQTRYVVNAAGVYADKFHNMVSEKKIHITPRRGDYCLLDKSAGSQRIMDCARCHACYVLQGLSAGIHRTCKEIRRKIHTLM